MSSPPSVAARGLGTAPRLFFLFPRHPLSPEHQARTDLQRPPALIYVGTKAPEMLYHDAPGTLPARVGSARASPTGRPPQALEQIQGKPWWSITTKFWASSARPRRARSNPPTASSRASATRM